MSAVASGARRTAPVFGLTYVLVCALLVFFGFSFTILTRVVESLRPWVLYVHVVTAAGWLVLVVVQAWLARSRKLALHRRLGKYGFGLGVLAAVSALLRRWSCAMRMCFFMGMFFSMDRVPVLQGSPFLRSR